MNRHHHFPKNPELNHKYVVSNTPKTLYPQQTDWTCSIACIRTMLSGFLAQVPSEEYFVETYALKPGPHYSKHIKQLHILDEYDAIYGCDQSGTTFDSVLELMEKGYFVMLESMYNYAHWYVLLGHYPCADGNIEKSRMLIYDPYYNEIRMLNTDEFLGMWIDGNYEHSRVEKDFIAVKGK